MLALGPTTQQAILLGLEACLAAGWLSLLCRLSVSGVVLSGAYSSCSLSSWYRWHTRTGDLYAYYTRCTALQSACCRNVSRASWT